MTMVDDELRLTAQERIERRQRAVRPIFAFMDEWGIKRSWLAAKLGMTRAQIWNYEHGMNNPPVDFVDRACAALGRTREWLGLPAAPAQKRQKRAS